MTSLKQKLRIKARSKKMWATIKSQIQNVVHSLCEDIQIRQKKN